MDWRQPIPTTRINDGDGMHSDWEQMWDIHQDNATWSPAHASAPPPPRCARTRTAGPPPEDSTAVMLRVVPYSAPLPVARAGCGGCAANVTVSDATPILADPPFQTIVPGSADPGQTFIKYSRVFLQ